MEDTHMRLDDKLGKLEASLRAGDRDAAFDIYLLFDAELTGYVRGEERLLFPVLERFTSMPTTATRSMRTEHRSLRRLVDTLGELLARDDQQGGLDIVSKLRSVLILHVAKEEWVLMPLLRPMATSAV
jgi:iron-sulfur cluster repair protein YtfE (RIC family)